MIPALTRESVASTTVGSLADGRRGGQVAAKRVFDLVFASVVLALLLPMMAVSALAIALDSRGPILYRSTPLGRQGRPFRMLKLCTMVIGPDTMAADGAAASLVSGALKAPR